MPTDPKPHASERGDWWGRGALAIAVVAAIGGGIHHFRSRRPEATVHAAARVEAADRFEGTEAPPSGRDEDCSFVVDASSDLALGPEVIECFDAFLSTTGEEGAAAIRAKVAAAIARLLPEGRAATEALSLFDEYLLYREAGRSLRAPADDLAARLAALRELRRRHFGDRADPLFGAEERAIERALAQRRIRGGT
jgi:hypothetical protein